MYYCSSACTWHSRPSIVFHQYHCPPQLKSNYQSWNISRFKLLYTWMRKFKRCYSNFQTYISMAAILAFQWYWIKGTRIRHCHGWYNIHCKFHANTLIQSYYLEKRNILKPEYEFISHPSLIKSWKQVPMRVKEDSYLLKWSNTISLVLVIQHTSQILSIIDCVISQSENNLRIWISSASSASGFSVVQVWPLLLVTMSVDPSNLL